MADDPFGLEIAIEIVGQLPHGFVSLCDICVQRLVQDRREIAINIRSDFTKRPNLVCRDAVDHIKARSSQIVRIGAGKQFVE